MQQWEEEFLLFCFGTLLLHGRPYCVAKKMCHDYSTASEFTFEIHSTFTWRSLIAKNESKDDHLKKTYTWTFTLSYPLWKIWLGYHNVTRTYSDKWSHTTVDKIHNSVSYSLRKVHLNIWIFAPKIHCETHSGQNSKSHCFFYWLFSLNFRAKNKHVI